jgi:hypothetical protein
MWSQTTSFALWLTTPDHGRVNLQNIEAIILSPKVITSDDNSHNEDIVNVLLVGISGKTYNIKTCKDKEEAARFVEDLFKQITNDANEQVEKTE